MKTLRSRSTRIALFKHNQIPFHAFINAKHLDAFRKKFVFNQITPFQDATSNEIGAINFDNGLYNAQDGNEVAIVKLAIEQRRLHCEIVGDSKYLDNILEEIRQYFLTLDNNTDEKFLIAVVESNETEIISHLEFSPLKLLSPLLVDKIIPDGLSKASTPFAQARLGTIVANFQVDFHLVEDSKLLDSRINMARKEFIIQSANGYGLDEQIFASKAPMATDSHLEFLQSLENTFRE